MSDKTAPTHLATRLRFRHLQMLLALESHGSLRAAAELLNLTQPAVSKALGEVERLIGQALFDRTARGLTPNEAGAVLIRSARLMLVELDHVRQETAAGGKTATVIRIGAPPFVAQTFLPDVLKRLCSRTPAVHAQVLEERVPALVQALDAGEVDALITSYPAPTPRSAASQLRYENLFDADYAVIAPAKHPLTRTRRIGWQHLAREDWVMPAWSSMVRRVLEEAFIRAGAIPPAPVIESTSPATNLQLVAAGLGLGIVPAAILHLASPAVLVKRIQVTPMIAPGPVALVYRAQARNARVDFLREALGLPVLAASLAPAPGR